MKEIYELIKWKSLKTMFFLTNEKYLNFQYIEYNRPFSNNSNEISLI